MQKHTPQTQNILARVFGKRSEISDNVLDNLYIVMSKFGYSIQEMERLPVPTFILLLKLIEKESKISQKQMNQRGRRK